jgi:hypothetical protein
MRFCKGAYFLGLVFFWGFLVFLVFFWCFLKRFLSVRVVISFSMMFKMVLKRFGFGD